MLTLLKNLREPVNSISHMAGAVASIAGLTLLVVFSSLNATCLHIVSFTIFGSTLLMMYTSSSLYHGLKLSEKAINVFRKIDHIMIFFLIMK